MITWSSSYIILGVGWRNSFMICGGMGIVTPLIGLAFMKEPPNPIRIKLEEEEKKMADPEYKRLSGDVKE